MAYSPLALLDIISKNKNKKINASKIIETNPVLLPIIPKLVADRTSARGMAEDNNLNINRGILESIHAQSKNTRHNNSNIIKLFPDIELSIQVLISSILSPKKMTDIQLNYRINKTFSGNTPAMADMLDVIKTYVNTEYELEDMLPDILRESLFNSGAYAMAIIPESSVDDIINSDLLPSYSTEEFKSRADSLIDKVSAPINILASAQRTNVELTSTSSVEDFVTHLSSESNLSVTDNYNLFKFSKIKDSISKAMVSTSIKQGVSISQESLDKLEYLDIFREKRNIISNKQVVNVKQKTETVRKNIGRPMVIKLPTESVIPVFIPGNESKHIGYFVLLDENGKPLTSTASDLSTDNFNHILSGGSTQQSQLTITQKAYNNLISNTTNNIDVNGLFSMYKDVLENQIYTSIRNSLYGSNVEISNKNDIYFLMFTRALSEQHTNLLYIPKDLMVYFAFYYSEIGLGKSLLDNLSVLSSLRAILLFSKVMARAKQSIDVTKVNISLDPNDPDPEKTIEQVQESVYKLRQNLFPLGINNPTDLVTWIQRAGLQFSYENNPLLPNIKIDFENANLQHTLPDTELEEDLRKQTILALGLSPETIDNGFSPEFATTVVNNNILLSKRIGVYQKTLSKHLCSLHKMLLTNDEELRKLLRTHIKSHLDEIGKSCNKKDQELIANNSEQFIEQFIDKLGDNILIELPKPENTNLINLAGEYALYKDNLDIVLDSVISSDMFTDGVAGDVSAYVDNLKGIFKHYLLRKWMSDNNYFTEALELANTNKEEVDSMMATMTTHLTSTMRNSAALLNIMQKFKEATNKDLENISGSGEVPVSDAESGGSDENGTLGEQKENSNNIDSDIDLNF